MVQALGGAALSGYCVPQAVQMKAGMRSLSVFYVMSCRSWARTIADLSVSASPFRPIVEPAVATGSKTRIGLADALPGPANNRDFCRQAANANDGTVHKPARLLGDRFNPCPRNEQ